MVTFGKVLYQGENGYVERLLADEQGIMLTVCLSYNVVKLYRLDYTDSDGYPTNVAHYDLVAAMNDFTRMVEKLQTGVDLVDDYRISSLGVGNYLVAIWNGTDWLNVTMLDHDPYLNNPGYRPLRTVGRDTYYRPVEQEKPDSQTQEAKLFSYTSDDDNKPHQARRIDWNNI